MQGVPTTNWEDHWSNFRSDSSPVRVAACNIVQSPTRLLLWMHPNYSVFGRIYFFSVL